MNILPRQSFLLWVRSLVLVCVLIGLLVQTRVQAGGGPPPILPVAGSIKPGETTPIQMMAENITMNIQPGIEPDNALVKLNPEAYGALSRIWFPFIAEVEADFMMKNPTSHTVSMTVWFPLASILRNAGWKSGQDVPRLTSLQVSVDGTLLDYAVRELPNPRGADKPLLPWAGFPVTFPSGKETTIHVSYKLPPQPAGNGMILYYIFQNGSDWAGPIGRAELSLNLPYPASTESLAGMPPGVVLNGNQARWMWKDFEPGPEDGFAVSFLLPTKWQELETVRAAVQVNPQDGLAWLDLATAYYSLSVTQTGSSFATTIFSTNSIPQGIAAYQKAADLLPEHPAPHAGLGMLILAPYLTDRNASPAVIHYAEEEYQIAKALDAKNPSLLKEAGISRRLLTWLGRALDSYSSNDTSAMAGTYATETAEAALYNDATATAFAFSWACWAATGAECTATVSPTATFIISTTAPLETPSTTVEATNNGPSTVIIVSASVLGLIIMGYLAMKRLPRKPSQ